MSKAHMTELIADALGQFIAKLLGGDVEWYLAYRHPKTETLGVVSTLDPRTLADLLEAQAAALREGEYHGLRTHDIKLDEKPS